MPHLVHSKKKKDERGSPKLSAVIYRDIATFAASKGLTIGAVLESAWMEYKVAHGIVVPAIPFIAGTVSKKKEAG